MRRWTAALVVVMSATLLLATDLGAQSQRTLTVYSSLPLEGASAPQSEAIVKGARLALAEHGGRAGGFEIRYRSLSDGTARAGTWTPERASANARRAALDRSTIAYIGEFNSGASAISIPILNEVPIPQISPANQAVGLTRGGPGADLGEPDKYYPTGERHYVRLTPNDRVQGGALAAAMRSRGCRRIAALHDGEVYGAGVGALVRRAAGRAGLEVVANRRIRPRAPSFERLAAAVARERPQCTVFTGITANGAVELFKALGRALPRARLFGSDGVAESGFVDPREGGIPRRLGRRVLVTVSTVAPSALPAAGRAMLRRYRARYDERFPDPYAVYGYEAMDLVLDAVDAVGRNRQAVIDWLFRVRNRDSVLGRYSIDRFGDNSIRRYGVYRVRKGLLQWAGAVSAVR
jgi:branched-chain amino acid transport system substrate-binding protein